MKEILITSTVLILALLLLRRLFQKVLSRRVQYALWALVLIRLLVPVTLPASNFSVLTAVRSVEAAVSQRMAPQPLPTQTAHDPTAEPPAAPGQAPPSHEAPAAAAPRQEGPALMRLLPLIWTAGMAGVGGFFLLGNVRFYLRLKKARQPFASSGPISRRVYLLPDGVLPSPCLFAGAVYLTPAAIASPETLRHVLVHEETHARHRDPLWTLLRCVCLTVYWFDPLVWVAAVCARTDCELACDEGALALLGESERIPYGQTLLSLVPVSKGPGNPLTAATTMTAGKRQLKKRITRIARNPRQLAAAAAVAAVLAGLVSACTFTGACSTPAPSGLLPLQELPDDYSLEQARADGCVVYENGDITSGQELWDAFLDAAVQKRQPASIRLGFYYTLDDPSHYDPDYYEEIKDRYPVLYMQDLTYDGKVYTIRHFEDGEEIVRTYQYLMRYEGAAESPHASFQSYVRYVLTNDNAVTWQDLMRGMFSSQFGAYIDFKEVYSDLIYSSGQPNNLLDEVFDYYSAQTENEAFGGIFWEGDKLIINIVDGAPGAAALIRKRYGDMGVEYRTVRYSLAGLEAVVDFLGRYMRAYSIQLLDANEVTNQVDVGTSDFSPENLNAIRALVESRFPGMDCLNFEDHRGMSIRFT